MRRDSGQAAIETALVMPLWLLIVTGAIQVALVQQARLLTEYAAYSAARAGIVWGGNNERMRDAALLVLVPLFGGASTMEGLGQTYARARTLDRQLHEAFVAETPVPAAFKSSKLLGAVRVDVLSPRAIPEGEEELEFDAAGTLTEEDAVAAGRSAHGGGQPVEDPDLTLLTVRVRHLYELRLPFANQVIFAAWIAMTVSAAQGGPGLPNLSDGERALLWRLSRGEGPLGDSRRFFIPLTASWTLRMQSNFQRKWLMHPSEATR